MSIDLRDTCLSVLLDGYGPLPLFLWKMSCFGPYNATRSWHLDAARLEKVGFVGNNSKSSAKTFYIIPQQKCAREIDAHCSCRVKPYANDSLALTLYALCPINEPFARFSLSVVSIHVCLAWPDQEVNTQHVSASAFLPYLHI